MSSIVDLATTEYLTEDKTVSKEGLEQESNPNEFAEIQPQKMLKTNKVKLTRGEKRAAREVRSQLVRYWIVELRRCPVCRRMTKH